MIEDCIGEIVEDDFDRLSGTTKIIMHTLHVVSIERVNGKSGTAIMDDFGEIAVTNTSKDDPAKKKLVRPYNVKDGLLYARVTRPGNDLGNAIRQWGKFETKYLDALEANPGKILEKLRRFYLMHCAVPIYQFAMSAIGDCRSSHLLSDHKQTCIDALPAAEDLLKRIDKSIADYS